METIHNVQSGNAEIKKDAEYTEEDAKKDLTTVYVQTGVKLVKLNINFGAETAAEYEVTSVPTLVFFRDGKEVRRVTGAVKKAQIEEILKTL